jgi:hypothetical protein
LTIRPVGAHSSGWSENMSVAHFGGDYTVRTRVLLLAIGIMLFTVRLLAQCGSSLCDGTHTLGAPSALTGGCQMNEAGAYVCANLEVQCNENFGSTSGAGSSSASAAHQITVYNNNTKQSILTGSLFPIPTNGNGFSCNLSCSGTGASSPLVTSVTHTTTGCPAGIGVPYYFSHTVFYGSVNVGDVWSNQNTIMSSVITP